MNTASQKNESSERQTQSFQNLTGKTTDKSFSQSANYVNSSRFRALLERHGIYLAKPRGFVPCIFHQEKTPSLSIDTERGLFHCFGCGKGGGVKDFALGVGEPWGTERHSTRERARFAIQARRRQTEKQARAILQSRKDERDATLWGAWCEASTTATEAVELLTLFFRRPDLAAEFPVLVNKTESAYSGMLFQKTVLEAQVAGEIDRVHAKTAISKGADFINKARAGVQHWGR